MAIGCEPNDISISDAPVKMFVLSSMSESERLSLKKKLMDELTYVRTTAKNFELLYPKDLALVDACDLLPQKSLPDCAYAREKSDCSHSVEKKTGNHLSAASHRSAIKELKRAPPQSIEDAARNKRRRLESNKMKQCVDILKKLMTHQFGWVFNQPVDPVKLNIPDYFTIITKPMDLGTIKSKLENKCYVGVHDFASDVRLTFSNAMRYNPPGNDVHAMAKSLNNIFAKGWRTLEEKWGKETSTATHASKKNVLKQFHKPHKVVTKEPVYCLNSAVKRSLSLTEKQKLRQDLAEISGSNLPPQLICFLQKYGSCGPDQDEVELDVDVLDDEAAWELQKLIRGYVESKYVKSGDEDGTSTPPVRSGNTSIHEGGRGDDLVVSNACEGSRACTRDICGEMSSQVCSCRNDFTQSTSDVEYENSADKDPLSNHANATNKQRNNQDPDTDGSGSVLDEENLTSSPNMTAASVGFSGEGTSVTSEMQLSPGKALRAAILKSRFAETILKAQQKTLLDNGERRDAARMRREKEEMERKHQEDKSRIEAAIRAAEAAQEAEAKRKIEQEREAARLALQNMERTVEINENENILKDLEKFGYLQGGSSSDELESPDGIDGFGVFSLQGGGNPLERLGLFMKNEDPEDDEVPFSDYAAGNGDVEEDNPERDFKKRMHNAIPFSVNEKEEKNSMVASS